MASPFLQIIGQSSPLDRRAGLAALLGLLAAPLLGMTIAQSPGLAAGALIAVSVGGFLIGRPHLAAYAVCFGMFFTHVGVPLGVVYLDLGDLASVALLPIWLMHRLAGQQRPRITGAAWLIVAFLAWEFVSMVISGAPSEVQGRFVRQVQMSFTCIALMDLLADEDRLRTAFWCMAVAGGIEVLIALPEFGSVYRVGGAYHQPNILANVLSLAAVPVLALWSIARRQWLRVGLLGLLGALILTVILTISRGTYFALGFALLWWVRHNRRQVMLILGLGLLIGVVLPAVRGADTSDITERMEMRDTSVTHRWATVVNGLNAIQVHPVFGVGYGQFGELDRSVEVTSQAGRSAHNFYLSVAASCGIPALLLFLGVVGSILQRQWRWQANARAVGEAAANSERAVLVKGAQALMIYTLITILTKGVGLLLWCTLGVCAAAGQLPVPRRPETPTA